MISASATFETFLNRPGRTPVFGVAITDGSLQSDGSITGASVTHRISTSSPASGDFVGAAETLQPVSLRRLADPSEGRLELSEFRFRWLDEDGDATTAMRDVLDRTCVLYAGFQGLAGADFIVLFAGVVTDTELDRDSGGFYTVKAQSVLSRAVGRRLFEGGFSRLIADIGTTDDDFLVLSAAGWEAPGLMEIEDELISFDTLDATSDGWIVGGVTRGVDGTGVVVHHEFQQVREVFRVGPEHIVDVFSSVMGGDAPTKTQMGLATWLNTTALDDLETALDGDYQAAWTVRLSAIAQDWLEAEIARPLAAYMVENHLGLISLKLLGTPVSSADLADNVTDSDVISRPRWLGDYEERVNRVFVTYDASGAARAGEPLETYQFTDTGLIMVSGNRIYDQDIVALGIGAGSHGDLLAEPPERRVDRFGQAIPVVEAVTGLSHLRLELGDSITLAVGGVPQVERGNRDGQLAAEVVGMRYNFDRGTITWKLLTYAGSILFGSGEFSKETSLLLGGEAAVEIG